MRMNKDLISLLYLKFTITYGHKFESSHTSQEIIDIWCEEWLSGLIDIDSDIIKLALNECKMSLEWPPSLAEFRSLCEKHMGIPSFEEAFQMCASRNITHEFVKRIYSIPNMAWNFTQYTAEQMRKFFKNAYDTELQKYRLEQVSKYAIENQTTQNLLEAGTHGSDPRKDGPRGEGVRKTTDYLSH